MQRAEKLSREIHIKAAMKYCYRPTRMTKTLKLTITSVDEDVEQLELSYIAGGSFR